MKRIFLYRQRRFGKLGKVAAAITEACPLLTMLLDEATTTNLLVEVCRLYIASEIFLTELETLAYFNYYVTFPFLLCLERSAQQNLLYKDLLAKK